MSQIADDDGDDLILSWFAREPRESQAQGDDDDDLISNLLVNLYPPFLKRRAPRVSPLLTTIESTEAKETQDTQLSNFEGSLGVWSPNEANGFEYDGINPEESNQSDTFNETVDIYNNSPNSTTVAIAEDDEPNSNEDDSDIEIDPESINPHTINILLHARQFFRAKSYGVFDNATVTRALYEFSQRDAHYVRHFNEQIDASYSLDALLEKVNSEHHELKNLDQALEYLAVRLIHPLPETVCVIRLIEGIYLVDSEEHRTPRREESFARPYGCLAVQRKLVKNTESGASILVNNVLTVAEWNALSVSPYVKPVISIVFGVLRTPYDLPSRGTNATEYDEQPELKEFFARDDAETLSRLVFKHGKLHELAFTQAFFARRELERYIDPSTDIFAIDHSNNDVKTIDHLQDEKRGTIVFLTRYPTESRERPNFSGESMKSTRSMRRIRYDRPYKLAPTNSPYSRQFLVEGKWYTLSKLVGALFPSTEPLSKDHPRLLKKSPLELENIPIETLHAFEYNYAGNKAYPILGKGRETDNDENDEEEYQQKRIHVEQSQKRRYSTMCVFLNALFSNPTIFARKGSLVEWRENENRSMDLGLHNYHLKNIMRRILVASNPFEKEVDLDFWFLWPREPIDAPNPQDGRMKYIDDLNSRVFLPQSNGTMFASYRHPYNKDLVVSEWYGEVPKLAAHAFSHLDVHVTHFNIEKDHTLLVNACTEACFVMHALTTNGTSRIIRGEAIPVFSYKQFANKATVLGLNPLRSGEQENYTHKDMQLFNDMRICIAAWLLVFKCIMKNGIRGFQVERYLMQLRATALTTTNDRDSLEQESALFNTLFVPLNNARVYRPHIGAFVTTLHDLRNYLSRLNIISDGTPTTQTSTSMDFSIYDLLKENLYPTKDNKNLYQDDIIRNSAKPRVVFGRETFTLDKIKDVVEENVYREKAMNSRHTNIKDAWNVELKKSFQKTSSELPSSRMDTVQIKLSAMHPPTVYVERNLAGNEHAYDVFTGSESQGELEREDALALLWFFQSSIFNEASLVNEGIAYPDEYHIGSGLSIRVVSDSRAVTKMHQIFLPRLFSEVFPLLRNNKFNGFSNLFYSRLAGEGYIRNTYTQAKQITHSDMVASPLSLSYRDNLKRSNVIARSTSISAKDTANFKHNAGGKSSGVDKMLLALSSYFSIASHDDSSKLAQRIIDAKTDSSIVDDILNGEESKYRNSASTSNETLTYHVGYRPFVKDTYGRDPFDGESLSDDILHAFRNKFGATRDSSSLANPFESEDIKSTIERCMNTRPERTDEAHLLADHSLVTFKKSMLSELEHLDVLRMKTFQTLFRDPVYPAHNVKLQEKEKERDKLTAKLKKLRNSHRLSSDAEKKKKKVKKALKRVDREIEDLKYSPSDRIFAIETLAVQSLPSTTEFYAPLETYVNARVDGRRYIDAQTTKTPKSTSFGEDAINTHSSSRRAHHRLPLNPQSQGFYNTGNTLNRLAGSDEGPSKVKLYNVEFDSFRKQHFLVKNQSLPSKQPNVYGRLLGEVKEVSFCVQGVLPGQNYEEFSEEILKVFDVDTLYPVDEFAWFQFVDVQPLSSASAFAYEALSDYATVHDAVKDHNDRVDVISNESYMKKLSEIETRYKDLQTKDDAQKASEIDNTRNILPYTEDVPPREVDERRRKLREEINAKYRGKRETLRKLEQDERKQAEAANKENQREFYATLSAKQQAIQRTGETTNPSTRTYAKRSKPTSGSPSSSTLESTLPETKRNRIDQRISTRIGQLTDDEAKRNCHLLFQKLEFPDNDEISLTDDFMKDIAHDFLTAFSSTEERFGTAKIYSYNFYEEQVLPIYKKQKAVAKDANNLSSQYTFDPPIHFVPVPVGDNGDWAVFILMTQEWRAALIYSERISDEKRNELVEAFSITTKLVHLSVDVETYEFKQIRHESWKDSFWFNTLCSIQFIKHFLENIDGIFQRQGPTRKNNVFSKKCKELTNISSEKRKVLNWPGDLANELSLFLKAFNGDDSLEYKLYRDYAVSSVDPSDYPEDASVDQFSFLHRWISFINDRIGGDAVIIDNQDRYIYRRPSDGGAMFYTPPYTKNRTRFFSPLRTFFGMVLLFVDTVEDACIVFHVDDNISTAALRKIGKKLQIFASACPGTSGRAFSSRSCHCSYEGSTGDSNAKKIALIVRSLVVTPTQQFPQENALVITTEMINETKELINEYARRNMFDVNNDTVEDDLSDEDTQYLDNSQRNSGFTQHNNDDDNDDWFVQDSSPPPSLQPSQTRAKDDLQPPPTIDGETHYNPPRQRKIYHPKIGVNEYPRCLIRGYEINAQHAGNDIRYVRYTDVDLERKHGKPLSEKNTVVNSVFQRKPVPGSDLSIWVLCELDNEAIQDENRKRHQKKKSPKRRELLVQYPGGLGSTWQRLLFSGFGHFWNVGRGNKQRKVNSLYSTPGFVLPLLSRSGERPGNDVSAASPLPLYPPRMCLPQRFIRQQIGIYNPENKEHRERAEESAITHTLRPSKDAPKLYTYEKLLGPGKYTLYPEHPSVQRTITRGRAARTRAEQPLRFRLPRPVNFDFPLEERWRDLFYFDPKRSSVDFDDCDSVVKQFSGAETLKHVLESFAEHSVSSAFMEWYLGKFVDKRAVIYNASSPRGSYSSDCIINVESIDDRWVVFAIINRTTMYVINTSKDDRIHGSVAERAIKFKNRVEQEILGVDLTELHERFAAAEKDKLATNLHHKESTNNEEGEQQRTYEVLGVSAINTVVLDTSSFSSSPRNNGPQAIFFARVIAEMHAMQNNAPEQFISNLHAFLKSRKTHARVDFYLSQFYTVARSQVLVDLVFIASRETIPTNMRAALYNSVKRCERSDKDWRRTNTETFTFPRTLFPIQSDSALAEYEWPRSTAKRKEKQSTGETFEGQFEDRRYVDWQHTEFEDVLNISPFMRLTLDISVDSMKGLKGTGWLTDSHIRWYVGLFASDYPVLERAWVWQDLWVEYFRDLYSRHPSQIRSIYMSEKWILFVPNSGGSHWMACFFNVQQGVIHVFDSFGAYDSNYMRYVQSARDELEMIFIYKRPLVDFALKFNPELGARNRSELKNLHSTPWSSNYGDSDLVQTPEEKAYSDSYDLPSDDDRRYSTIKILRVSDFWLQKDSSNCGLFVIYALCSFARFITENPEETRIPWKSLMGVSADERINGFARDYGRKAIWNSILAESYDQVTGRAMPQHLYDKAVDYIQNKDFARIRERHRNEEPKDIRQLIATLSEQDRLDYDRWRNLSEKGRRQVWTTREQESTGLRKRQVPPSSSPQKSEKKYDKLFEHESSSPKSRRSSSSRQVDDDLPESSSSRTEVVTSRKPIRAPPSVRATSSGKITLPPPPRSLFSATHATSLDRRALDDLDDNDEEEAEGKSQRISEEPSYTIEDLFPEDR